MGDRPYFHSLVLDCAEPRKNADFYAELLAYSGVRRRRVGHHRRSRADAQLPLAPDHVATTWPDNDVPQQMHVDFFVSDIVAAHERVLDLGGRAVDPQDPPTPSPERGFRVYVDPAGHTFCLCRPSKTAW
jgi:predicted enzyme related to lactoylglutathione lyase